MTTGDTDASDEETSDALSGDEACEQRGETWMDPAYDHLDEPSAEVS